MIHLLSCIDLPVLLDVAGQNDQNDMKNKIHIIEVRGLIWAQLLSHLGSFHCSVQCLLAYHSWMTDWSPILIRLERNVDIHYRVKECKGKKTGWEDKQILVPSASCVDSGYCCFSILDQDMQNNVKEKHGPFLVRVRCSRASRVTIHWNPGFWKEGIFFSRVIKLLIRKHCEVQLITKRGES